MSITSASLRQMEPVIKPRPVVRKRARPAPAAPVITLLVTRPSIQDQIAAKLREVEYLRALEKVEAQRYAPSAPRYKAEFEIASTNAERGTVDIRIVNDPDAIAKAIQSNGGQSFFAGGSQYYRVTADLLRRIGADSRFLLIESAQ